MGYDGLLSRRAATDADTEYARRVHHDAYRDVVLRQFEVWDEVAQNRFFETDWAVGGYEILEWDGQACGYAAVDDRENDVLVRELVIDPPFQGKGIGTTVITDAIEQARARNVPTVIGALHQNRAAELYQRLGFVEVHRDTTHTHFRRS